MTVIYLMRSTRNRVAHPRPGAGRSNGFLFDLAPGGVCLAVVLSVRPGGLLHRLFTLTRRSGRYIFCGAFHPFRFPEGFPAQHRDALPYGVRTFLTEQIARRDRPLQP
jgi:hypothetical protein